METGTVSAMIAKAGRKGRYDPASLSARSEISDVLTLFCHSLDQRDWSLMDHVFHPDATVWYSMNPQVSPYQDWVTAVKVVLERMPLTFHQLGPALIHVDGDEAWTEAYVSTLHIVPDSAPAGDFWDGREEPYFGLSGGRYLDHFTHRDGLWKIARRETSADWRYDIPVSQGTFFPRRQTG